MQDNQITGFRTPGGVCTKFYINGYEISLALDGAGYNPEYEEELRRGDFRIYKNDQDITYKFSNNIVSNSIDNLLWLIKWCKEN